MMKTTITLELCVTLFCVSVSFVFIFLLGFSLYSIFCVLVVLFFPDAVTNYIEIEASFIMIIFHKGFYLTKLTIRLDKSR